MIYDGDMTEVPIDVLSMVVKTDQRPQMKIYGGETEMPVYENIWW